MSRLLTPPWCLGFRTWASNAAQNGPRRFAQDRRGPRGSSPLNGRGRIAPFARWITRRGNRRRQSKKLHICEHELIVLIKRR